MSFALLSLGLNILGGMNERSQQRNALTVDIARTEGENLIRQAKNEENAARAAFDGVVSSLNNNRMLAAAGRARNDAVTNAARVQEALTTGSIEEQIANAEQAGAYAAAVAMNGTGGSSVDSIDHAMRLKQARAGQTSKRRAGQLRADMRDQIAGVMPNAIAGLDIGTNSAGIDYATSFQRVQKPTGNILTDVLGWAAGNQKAAGQLASDTGRFFRTSSIFN